MTLGIRQLAMFASKNRQVVQIRIRVSHVEAVVYTGSLTDPVLNNDCDVITRHPATSQSVRD